jgi:hypothetical protein
MLMACQKHLKEKKLYQFIFKFSGNRSTRRKTPAGKAKSRLNVLLEETINYFFKVSIEGQLRGKNMRKMLLGV